VVKAAAGNRKSGEAVIKLLLEQRGADVVITREVVEIIARQFGQGVIMALLNEKGADVVITEEVVKAAAGN
jgi:predicted Fe-Mo cluster-binding NifX family protein